MKILSLISFSCLLLTNTFAVNMREMNQLETSKANISTSFQVHKAAASVLKPKISQKKAKF